MGREKWEKIRDGSLKRGEVPTFVSFKGDRKAEKGRGQWEQAIAGRKTGKRKEPLWKGNKCGGSAVRL